MPVRVEDIAMNTMTVSLNDWESRLVLAALAALDQKWTAINKTSNDDDLVADVGNDLVKLRMTRELLEGAAASAFGSKMVEHPWDIYE